MDPVVAGRGLGGPNTAWRVIAVAPLHITRAAIIRVLLAEDQQMMRDALAMRGCYRQVTRS